MLSENRQREHIDEIKSMGGIGSLNLDMLYSCVEKPSHIKVFAKASLAPGNSIGYHIHTGESETYYILSGNGTYNDNGNIVSLKEGDVAVTYSGEGHSLENTGNTNLEFMVLIVFE